MQSSSKEARKKNGQFGWIYKVLCQEKCVKPLPAVQAYLHENRLHFCADRVDLKDWSPILNGIAENRSLSGISIYSRSRCRKLREKVNSEERLAKLRQREGKHERWPIVYTNFLLRCVVDAIAVFAKNSLTITTITLDGIPLAPKYLNILCAGLASNRSLMNLSLAKCLIGDRGCDLLLGSLRENLNIRLLDLSSCHLTCRSAMCLSLFLKSKRSSLLQNDWQESHLRDGLKTENQGLQTLVLNGNRKFGDNGARQLMHILRNDFWLKSLDLQNCGITKHGGESIVELLQINSVLAKMTLMGNEIPNHILQIVSRILKRRQERGEGISLRKRLPNLKKAFSQNATNSRNLTSVWRIEKHLSKTEKCNERSMQNRRSKKNRKFQKKMYNCERKRGMKNSFFDRKKNLRELESELLHLINRNIKCKEELRNKGIRLQDEIHERMRVEKESEKILERLNDLKSKVIILSCLQSKIYGESQLLGRLRRVFENLETLSTAKQFATDSDRCGEEIVEKKMEQQ